MPSYEKKSDCLPKNWRKNERLKKPGCAVESKVTCSTWIKQSTMTKAQHNQSVEKNHFY